MSCWRCEYCDRNLLADEVVFNTCDYDHIIPKSKCKDDWYMCMGTAELFGSAVYAEEKLRNFALSCKICHKAKGQFNPNATLNVYLGQEELSTQARTQLINCVQQRNQSIISGYKQIFELTRELVEQKGG